MYTAFRMIAIARLPPSMAGAPLADSKAEEGGMSGDATPGLVLRNYLDGEQVLQGYGCRALRMEFPNAVYQAIVD